MDNLTATTESVIKLLIINNGTINSGGVNTLMFGWTDYMLFFMMLGFSAMIGIYFGCFGKQDTAADYLLGGKTMGVFPVSMSLVATMISGITLLGVPSDVYMHGASYWLSVFSIPIVCVVVAFVYMPVFYKLQLTSSYEYLKLRFDSSIRILASLLFTIMTILYVPIVIYIPALAFAQVSGLDLYVITLMVCVICIFYTCLGGLKAVVWTDTLQIIVMVGSMLTVFYLGMYEAGGFFNVWDKAVNGQRLDIFLMDPDPTLRDSFFTVMIGFTVGWISYTGVNQGCVQRFLALPSLNHVKRSLCIFAVGITIFNSVSIFTGLIMHAMYADCDPLTVGIVQRPDQLLPYHVMDVASHMHGLPGLFIAGVVSAALSTLSSALNTLSGTIYEDFVSPFMPKDTTEKTASNIMKLTVVIIGVICTGMVFVIQHLGGVFQMSISFAGITSGPLLGLFTLGMLFPSANKKGALYGGLGALLFLAWIVIGAQYHIAMGNVKHAPKPLSVENCDFPTNLTSSAHDQSDQDEDLPFFIYRISMYYYTLIGTMATILIGLPVSWLTRKDTDPEVHKDLISPVVYWTMGKKNKSFFSDEKAYHIVVDMDSKPEKLEK